MAAKLPIFISRHFDFAKIWKTTFPKEFFNEILPHNSRLGIHLHTEIKIEKFYSCAILGAKQFFGDPPMLIYAN